MYLRGRLPGLTVGISADSGFKYASFFIDHLGDEGLPII